MSTPFITLNLVVLRSAEMERLVEFYTRLGLEFTQHRHGTGPEHFAAELNGGVFEIYPLFSDDAATAGTRVGFTVPSLDTIIATLAGYPAAILSPPKESPWGYRAVITDPDGHRVELVEARR